MVARWLANTITSGVMHPSIPSQPELSYKRIKSTTSATLATVTPRSRIVPPMRQRDSSNESLILR